MDFLGLKLGKAMSALWNVSCFQLYYTETSRTCGVRKNGKSISLLSFLPPSGLLPMSWWQGMMGRWWLKAEFLDLLTEWRGAKKKGCDLDACWWGRINWEEGFLWSMDEQSSFLEGQVSWQHTTIGNKGAISSDLQVIVNKVADNSIHPPRRKRLCWGSAEGHKETEMAPIYIMCVRKVI